jgi:ribonuclease HII
MAYPDFTHEDRFCGVLAGVDEAGRGPWAGPVVAAAVILDRRCIPEGLNDSKKLSALRRAALFEDIMANAAVGLGQASVAEIDTLNILRANDLAMTRALAALPICPAHALIDGNHIPPGLEMPATAIVQGDAKSLSIAAASIIAKISRDRMMRALDLLYPHYSWRTNQGYGTPQHARALQTYGPSPQHRHSFKPVREALNICR